MENNINKSRNTEGTKITAVANVDYVLTFKNVLKITISKW